MERLLQAFGPEGKVETILEGVSRDAAKPLGEALRVTEIAAARDLGAARYAEVRQSLEKNVCGGNSAQRSSRSPSVDLK
jgi:hypothetical protein